MTKGLAFFWAKRIRQLTGVRTEVVTTERDASGDAIEFGVHCSRGYGFPIGTFRTQDRCRQFVGVNG